MRMYASEVILSDTYLEKCYDSFLRSSNRGYMTLFSEQCFDFGLHLIEKISSSLTQEKLKSELGITQKAKKNILGDKE